MTGCDKRSECEKLLTSRTTLSRPPAVMLDAIRKTDTTSALSTENAVRNAPRQSCPVDPGCLSSMREAGKNCEPLIG